LSAEKERVRRGDARKVGKGRGLDRTVHDELEHLEDWLEDELTETTDKRLAGGVGTLLLGPLTGLDVEEVVTPHLLHELLRVCEFG